jgi:cytidylate kinase
MKRTLAQEMGLNIQEFNLLGDKPENQKEFDLKYEEYQKSLKLTDNIILDSRLGFYAQPHAFKILLDVDDTAASQRIFSAKRETDTFTTPAEALKAVQERNLNDQQRYQKLYDVDIRNYKNYSLIVDTSERTPKEVLDIILKEFEARTLKKGATIPIGSTSCTQRTTCPHGTTCTRKTPCSRGSFSTLQPSRRPKSLLKNILLLLALLIIAGFRITASLLAK